MENISESLSLALSHLAGNVEYPPLSHAPYGPDQAYPELSAVEISQTPNPIFDLVRNALRDMGLDAARLGTAQWNPFADLVKPGGKIVVKPNWVLHHNEGTGGMDCMITHPSVLRAVLEYAFLAKPEKVTLGDAPLQGCDFDRMLDHGNMRAVIASFQDRKLPLVVKDFRRTVMRSNGDLKTVAEDVRSESDYVLVDLGEDSLLEPISKDWRQFRVTVYDPRKMWRHHHLKRHRYLLAKDILEADLVINVPKLKAHKKAGITCCLKNLIGINGNKEYLPHHRKGGADDRHPGDNYAHGHLLLRMAENVLDFANAHLRAYPRSYRWMTRVAWRAFTTRQKKDRDAQIEGSWYGNDTIWRTCLDLNRALLYADVTAHLNDQIQRQEISIVDAVIAGQGEGPLAPEPLKTGVVYAARNPAVGDFIGACLLGFDADKIRLLSHSCDEMRYRISSSTPQTIHQHALQAIQSLGVEFPRAAAPHGWRGHIEKDTNEVVA